MVRVDRRHKSDDDFGDLRDNSVPDDNNVDLANGTGNTPGR